MIPIRLVLARAALAATVVFAAAGCEEAVVRPPGLVEPFTLWSILDPTADTQWVWVFPIEKRLAPYGDDLLDARVTTTELETGEVRAWRDSLVLQDDGLYVHVFWSRFRPRFERRYRMTVVRADGAVSSAETTVPADGRLVRLPPLGLHHLPVHVRTTAPRLNRLELTYQLQLGEGSAGRSEVSMVIPYDAMKRPVDEGWEVVVDLRSDYEYLYGELSDAGRITSYGITLRALTLDVIVADAAWAPPEGFIFDAEELVVPGTLSNVENGLGFVGAGFRLQMRWLPPEEMLRSAGFRLP